MFVFKFRIIHSVNDYFHIVQKLMDFNDCFSFIRFLYLLYVNINFFPRNFISFVTS